MTTDADTTSLQKRTIRSLRMMQIPGQAAVSGVAAVVALLASDLVGSDRLAGVGSAGATLGAAFTAVPLAAMMRRRGRRPALVTAFGIGAIGAVVAAFGGETRSLLLFIVGMSIFGAGQAGALQSRYVAADLAPNDVKATAIASVVWVGTLGAVFGPLLTPVEKAVAENLGLSRLVGPFMAASVFFALSGAIAFIRLRPDPLVMSGGVSPTSDRVPLRSQVRVALRAIGASRLAQAGVAAMIVSQATMVAVMTMTPPHMKDHGHADLSALVVALHIMGMYGFSPIIGRITDRLGRLRSLEVGAVVLGVGIVSTVVAGYVPSLMFIGLLLLGIGWSIGLIAGTTLVSESVDSSTKVEVQGTADLLMSLCGGLAAFASGFIKQAWGFHALADIATVAAAGLLVLVWITRLGVRPPVLRS
ncbi:MAG: MFS transporter [Ilumatobacteraceae bacterium]